MTTERQREQASLYALSALTGEEQRAFEVELGQNPELRECVQVLQRAAGLLALAVPAVRPPDGLKTKVLLRLDFALDRAGASAGAPAATAGFSFIAAEAAEGWKPLPVRGAWIKVLSIDRAHGYAVLLGKLDPGVRYPAHTHAGSEDLYLLTGDLHVGEHVLRPGDFHHSDPGTAHGENYSVTGCTLLAVLSTEHALARFALASP